METAANIVGNKNFKGKRKGQVKDIQGLNGIVIRFVSTFHILPKVKDDGKEGTLSYLIEAIPRQKNIKDVKGIVFL